jgi:outer membrane protein assembly factor BamA
MFTLPCSAQYVVKRMVFQGGKPYKQAQLETVAGLKAGQHITTKDVAAASQRLMDTGAFADIDAHLDGPVAGIDVIFKLKTGAIGGFLPVSFENIVWLIPAEREAALRQAVPLYDGRLPAASSMQAAVRTVLTQLLTAKGVQATVETTEEPSTETRPTPLIAYRVTTPKVMLGAVHLGGVSPELAAAEKSVLTALTRKPYNEGFDTPLERTLIQPYLDAGYIDAKLDGLTRTPAAIENNAVKVDVAASVVSGDSFKVAGITWDGSDLFSTDAFAKSNKLHPGDVASDSLLRESYKPLLDAYLTQGYVDVSVDTHSKEDTTTHTVTYTLSVLPGNVYKLGSLTVIGLTPDVRAKFDAQWKLVVGGTYDGVYPFTLLKKLNFEDPSFRQLNGTVVTTANPDTLLVDIVYTFFGAKN